MRHDLLYLSSVDGATRTHIVDVSVVTTRLGATVAWPTRDEVEREVDDAYRKRAAECTRRNEPVPDRPHNDTEVGRATRQLATRATVGTELRGREQHKRVDFAARYTAASDAEEAPIFRPFVVTAIGSAAKDAGVLIKEIGKRQGRDERNRLRTRISMVLLKSAVRMSKERTPLML